MSNLFSEINSRLRGTSSRSGPGASDQSSRAPTTSAMPSSGSRQMQQPSQRSESSAPRMPPLPPTSSLSQSIGIATSTDSVSLPQQSRQLPLWLNPSYAKHIVKGNFMTLSSRPKTVDEGEWIAHQAVEHYRLLWNFVRIIVDKEEDGHFICTCPKMSAGNNHSFTWLSQSGQPTELPAREYITLMQRWISGKVENEILFPSDPSSVSFAHNPSITTTPLLTGSDEWVGKRSGFPKDFVHLCRIMFRQMFRVYAHLYWEHFVEPFYHLNLEKQLNSCFSHFILTATTLDMLKPEDMEAMQPLIDLWVADGTFPQESKVSSQANSNRRGPPEASVGAF